MSIDDLSQWPREFAVLRNDPPSGWLVIDNVLDPVLFVFREVDGYAVKLGATMQTRNGRVDLYAPSLNCDWVCGGGFICPLPNDVGATITSLLDGAESSGLTFPTVISLMRADVIDTRFDAQVFQSASDEAELCEADLAIPDLTATLYAYQAKGIQWMRKALARTGGVILADEMGLGKTLQIIGLLLLDLPKTQSPALIVCPTTLIANWARELQKFAPSLTFQIHRGAGRARLPRHLQSRQIVITTYDTLVLDLVLFKAIKWSWLVCDEAQALKNPEAKRRVAVSQIRADRSIPVTGTPVENHLLDLWSLVDIAIPGLLGPKSAFYSAFPDTPDAARSLSSITSPTILRRCVRDVALDLPERIDVNVPLEMDSNLAAEYEAVRQETLAQYPIAGAMVATGQLQIFCAHPSLRKTIVRENGWEDCVAYSSALSTPLMTPKLERALELLDEAFQCGKKVLVFANFNACADILKRSSGHLPRALWGVINGSTPSADRQRIVDEFTEHHGPAALVLNPRAAGAGLNITAATIVIHFTQVWNPALEQQASARAHRRGQTQPVTIYHMYYVDSVEQVMLERSERRRLLGQEAVPLTDDTQDLDRALRITPIKP